MDRGRSRKTKHLDRIQKYDVMENKPQKEAAIEAFNRPAYQSVSVMEYLINKYKIRVDNGQKEKKEDN